MICEKYTDHITIQSHQISGMIEIFLIVKEKENDRERERICDWNSIKRRECIFRRKLTMKTEGEGAQMA